MGFLAFLRKSRFSMDFPCGVNFSQNFNDFRGFLGPSDPPKSVSRVGETLILKKPLFSKKIRFFCFFSSFSRF